MTSIGIDLGTTNSVISRLEDGKAVPIAIDGHAIVPSVVFFDGARVVAGREARNLELLHPERTVRSVKRRMGTREAYTLGDRMVSPEEVSAEILRVLKEGAERALGEPVRDVVITVPAYFDDAQRRATLKAGQLAGLDVQRLLNEPTSASLCYEQTGAAQTTEAGSENVMVFDLGGGTFDVSILEVVDGIREVRATAGNTRLGGDDFDDKLLSVFVDELKTKAGVDPRDDPRALARLRRAAEETKIRLSSDTRVMVREEFLTNAGGAPVHLELELTRRRFEDLIRDLVASAVTLAAKALSDAQLTEADLSRVLLVGGSTRIPLVRAMIEERFGARVHEEIDVDLAVGLGAAIQSALLHDEPIDRILVDVAAHSLGIRALGAMDIDRADTYAPVLRRNTVLPASRTEEFYTVSPQQAELNVEVFQGEERRASQNTPVGAFRCDLVPSPQGSPVRVEFSYDLNGVVTVSVSQPGHATTKTVALTIPARSSPKDASRSETRALEQKASALLPRLAPAEKAKLEALLAKLRAAAEGSPRRAAEDALLDFFLDVEDDDSDVDGEQSL